MSFTPEHLLAACRAAFPDRHGLAVESINPLPANQHEMAVFFLRWDGVDRAQPLILRRYPSPPTWRGDDEGRAGRELAVLRGLEGRELLAPRAYAAGTDSAGEWLLLEALPGRNWWLPLGMVNFDKVLPGIVRQQVRLMVRLHSLDPAAISGKTLPTVRAQEVIGALRERVRPMRDLDVIAALDQVAALMAPVEEREPRLIHGDADITNILVSSAPPGDVVGWLDWDEAALGDPRWDVAALVNSLRGGYQMDALAARAVADFRKETVRPIQHIAAWTAMLAVLRWAEGVWLREEIEQGRAAGFPAAERIAGSYDSHRAWALEVLAEAEAEAQ